MSNTVYGGYSLETSCQCACNEYIQDMFLWRNKKLFSRYLNRSAYDMQCTKRTLTQFADNAGPDHSCSHMWALFTRSASYEPAHDKTYKMACMCVKLKLSWASAQSDQSRRCPQESQAGLSLRWSLMPL